MIAGKNVSEKMLLWDDAVSLTAAIEVDPINGQRLEGLRLQSTQASQKILLWKKMR